MLEREQNKDILLYKSDQVSSQQTHIIQKHQPMENKGIPRYQTRLQLLILIEAISGMNQSNLAFQGLMITFFSRDLM